MTKNLLTLLLAAPVHGICALLCARDARFFDLVLLCARTRLPGAFGNLRLWKANSYSPLTMELAAAVRRKNLQSIGVVCAHRTAERR